MSFSLTNLQFVAFFLTTLFLFSVFAYFVSLHRSRTGTLPNVNLQMPKVPNLTVPSVNFPQMASFSPPNWMTANYDSECVSALSCLGHKHMSLA